MIRFDWEKQKPGEIKVITQDELKKLKEFYGN